MKNLTNKQKVIIISIFIIVACIGVLLGIFTGISRKNREENNNLNVETSINDSGEHNTKNISSNKEFIEKIQNVTIKGIAKSNSKGYIYITDSCYFGEFGYRMEDEYTAVTIENKSQTCIDYFTSEEFSANDISLNDILICTGDLIKRTSSINEFDTKENSIIVLKREDYSKMMVTAQENEKAKITVGQMYLSSNYIYLKYDVEDNTRGMIYNFPFIVKAYITEDTQILGDLEKGKMVKVEFDNKNYGYDRDGGDLKSIKIIK